MGPRHQRFLNGVIVLPLPLCLFIYFSALPRVYIVCAFVWECANVYILIFVLIFQGDRNNGFLMTFKDFSPSPALIPLPTPSIFLCVALSFFSLKHLLKCTLDHLFSGWNSLTHTDEFVERVMEFCEGKGEKRATQ